MNPQYFDIIIFGAIAVFFIFKLIKSLGVRPDGKEEGGFGQQDNRKELSADDEKKLSEKENKDNFGKVLMMPLNAKLKSEQTEEQTEIMDKIKSKKNDEDAETKAVFYKIYSIDNSFHPDTFLQGARNAFTMIIEAFSKDDEDTLKTLVDEKVFATFKKFLDAYKEKQQTLEQTLIGIDNVKIEKAVLEGSTAKITVLFETEQAKVVKDSEGKVMEDETVLRSNVKEWWTFAKNLKDSAPDWLLISVKGCKEQEKVNS